jgi:hypothetical protein
MPCEEHAPKKKADCAFCTICLYCPPAPDCPFKRGHIKAREVGRSSKSDANNGISTAENSLKHARSTRATTTEQNGDADADADADPGPSTPVRRCKARRATQVVTSYKDAESSPDLTPQLKQPPPARPPPPSASEVVLNSARLHSIMNGNDAVDTPDAPNTPKRRDQLLMVMKGLGLGHPA